MKRVCVGSMVLLMIVMVSGCGSKEQQISREHEMQQWLEEAELTKQESSEELYQAALEEDTLVVYSVSSRAFDVKQSFEKEYPGLTVEIKDIRGNTVVDNLISNYKSGNYGCDLVICSDCDGSLYKELIEPGILYSYLPWDIAPKLKPDHGDKGLTFLGEALMMFYNNEVFDTQPIKNIWELTDAKYKGKIIMANPLSSFSTYGFCTAMFTETEAMEQSYQEYFKKPLSVTEGKSVGEIFWEMAAPNIVFTNSSDEVVEGIGNDRSNEFWLGIMISSKMRYQELGYHFTPIYQAEPFAAVYTPNSVNIAGGAKNVNSAKLFIRYLLGEKDGTGEGLKPYSLTGTWSTRIDVPDGNLVPLKDIALVNMNKDYIYENREQLFSFFRDLLKENVVQ